MTQPASQLCRPATSAVTDSAAIPDEPLCLQHTQHIIITISHDYINQH